MTKAPADRFETALRRLPNQAASRLGKGEPLYPDLHRAQEDALRSYLDDLSAELADDEALQAGERVVLRLESFVDLPWALTNACIATGLIQRELAARLGLEEQQISATRRPTTPRPASNRLSPSLKPSASRSARMSCCRAASPGRGEIAITPAAPPKRPPFEAASSAATANDAQCHPRNRTQPASSTVLPDIRT